MCRLFTRKPRGSSLPPRTVRLSQDLPEEQSLCQAMGQAMASPRGEDVEGRVLGVVPSPLTWSGPPLTREQQPGALHRDTDPFWTIPCTRHRSTGVLQLLQYQQRSCAGVTACKVRTRFPLDEKKALMWTIEAASLGLTADKR